jgi:SAM-dependent methyltransferase
VGKSDSIIFPWYDELIKLQGDVALLGFQNDNRYKGDLYDRSLGNWDINSEWSLKKKYDTIVCTRCAYFAKDPEDFILRCYQFLNEDGVIFVDWGLGDHWRFENYKVGWVKEGEHEYAYGDDNYLWSAVWDDSFLKDDQVKEFQQNILKFGYTDLKLSIFNEVPSVLSLSFVEKYFDFCVHIKTIWKDSPQLYIFILGIRKEIKENGLE